MHDPVPQTPGVPPPPQVSGAMHDPQSNVWPQPSGTRPHETPSAMHEAIQRAKRVASTMFIRLLERFPRFETSAYLLVLTIGSKLLVDWAMNSAQQPDRANFHNSSSPLFWAFWSIMAIKRHF